MPNKDNSPFDPSKIFQIGIVVRNIDETVKYYQEVFGIGPFEIFEVNYTDATYYGEKAGYRGKRAFAKMGPMTIELIELIEGKTIHEAFLKEKGEGLHHIGIEVKHFKEGVAKAEKLGFKVTQGWQREDGLGFAYLDSDKIGGVIFEMIQWSAQKNGIQSLKTKLNPPGDWSPEEKRSMIPFPKYLMRTLEIFIQEIYSLRALAEDVPKMGSTNSSS